MRRWTLLTGALLVVAALTGTMIVNAPETTVAHYLAGLLWLGGLVLAVALAWEFLAWVRGRMTAK